MRASRRSGRRPPSTRCSRSRSRRAGRQEPLPTITIRPRPRSSIPGITALQQRWTPRTLTSKTRHHSSGSSSQTRRGYRCRRSRRAGRRPGSANARDRLGEVTSIERAAADLRGDARPARACAGDATSIPAAASSRAMFAPIPRPPPVTAPAVRELSSAESRRPLPRSHDRGVEMDAVERRVGHGSRAEEPAPRARLLELAGSRSAFSSRRGRCAASPASLPPCADKLAAANLVTANFGEGEAEREGTALRRGEPQVVDARSGRVRPVHDHARQHGGERRAADDGEGPPRLDLVARVDRHRLRADVRGADDHRRQARRPLRPAAYLRRRARRSSRCRRSPAASRRTPAS